MTPLNTLGELLELERGMKDKIILEAEIDPEKNETRVKPIVGDPWGDLGFWLEVTGYMAYNAMKYREWNKEQIKNYVNEYIEKCLNDYKNKIKPTP